MKASYRLEIAPYVYRWLYREGIIYYADILRFIRNTIGFEGDVARVNAVLPTADAHNDVFGKKGVVAISWYHGILIYRNERIRQILTTAKLA